MTHLKPFYASFGATKAGSPRWRCNACRKTFSAPKSSTLRQRESHKNKLIFQLLVNGMALRRICEVAEIGPNALYRKIDFIHRQCEKFLSAREAKLPGMAIRRLYLGVDRQDYVASMKKISTLAAAASLRDRVAKAYAQAKARADVEASDAPGKHEKLPAQGMQIHFEYTLYAHFMHIRRLTAGVEKIRFFLDQDSCMRAACLAAWTRSSPGSPRR